VHGVVILHPAIDQGESSIGIGYWADPDIVALDGFDEGLGHAVALGAFHWRETWGGVERQRDLDGFVGGKNRSVAGEPLHRVRGADCAKALLDAAAHHVADHLAGDTGRGGDPAIFL
jgi:hypothetical protein